MRPASVVVFAQGLDRAPGFSQRQENVLVEALVAETAVEAFDEGVLRWLPRRDVVQAYSMRRGSCKHRQTRHFGPIIHNDRLGISALAGNPIEHGRHPCTADRRIDLDRQRFAAEVVHDR